MASEGLGEVESAVAAAVAEAKHLAKVDVAGVAAMRVAARRLDRAEELDNVALATLLRYLDAFGLTPKARESLGLIAKRAAKLEKGATDDGKDGGDRVPATGTDGKPARVAQLVAGAQRSRAKSRRTAR
jgi:hypothetical protein